MLSTVFIGARAGLLDCRLREMDRARATSTSRSGHLAGCLPDMAKPRLAEPRPPRTKYSHYQPSTTHTIHQHFHHSNISNLFCRIKLKPHTRHQRENKETRPPSTAHHARRTEAANSPHTHDFETQIKLESSTRVCGGRPRALAHDVLCAGGSSRPTKNTPAIHS